MAANVNLVMFEANCRSFFKSVIFISGVVDVNLCVFVVGAPCITDTQTANITMM